MQVGKGDEFRIFVSVYEIRPVITVVLPPLMPLVAYFPSPLNLHQETAVSPSITVVMLFLQIHINQATFHAVVVWVLFAWGDYFWSGFLYLV